MRCLISKVLKSEGIYKGFTFQPLAMYMSPQMSIGQAQQGGSASPNWLPYQTGIYILDCPLKLAFIFLILYLCFVTNNKEKYDEKYSKEIC